VVAEIQTKNALPLLHYSCSPRVVALPTGQLNARRVRGAPPCAPLLVAYTLGLLCFVELDAAAAARFFVATPNPPTLFLTPRS